MKLRASRFTCALGLASIFAVAGLARGDGMRCGTNLIAEGDTPRRVQSRCGPAQNVRTWVEFRYIPVRVEFGWVERAVEVKFEEWTYDRGPQEFVHFIVFENGRLITVNTGDYGEPRRE